MKSQNDKRAFESAVQYAYSTWNTGCVSFNKAVEQAASYYKVDSRAVADELLKHPNNNEKEQ